MRGSYVKSTAPAVAPHRETAFEGRDAKHGTVSSIHHFIALMRTGRVSAAQLTLDYLSAAGTSCAQAAMAHELGEAAAAFCQNKPGEALAQMLAARQRHGEPGHIALGRLN